jgi:hypothetical protein
VLQCCAFGELCGCTTEWSKDGLQCALPIRCKKRVFGLSGRCSRGSRAESRAGDICSPRGRFERPSEEFVSHGIEGPRLSPDKAWSAAIANLEALLKSGVIQTQLFPGGPQRRPFILVGGHWGAASCALLPRLFDRAAKNLEAAELCFSIPHSSALLIFPKGDQAYRAAMREMIRAQEGAERKLLTLDFFTFDSTGPVPLGDE